MELENTLPFIKDLKPHYVGDLLTGKKLQSG